MRVVVIGAGLLGLTSAHYLRERGHEVVVLDRQPGPGRETSFANGGLLTPSMSDPWNSPGSWRVLLASLGRSNSPLKLRLSALPSLGGWGIDFIRNSGPEAYQKATLLNLKLGQYSLEALRELRLSVKLDYRGADTGSLRIFRDAETFAAQTLVAQSLQPHGIEHRTLTGDALIACEPALAPLASALVGAIHYPDDGAGDAHSFCVALEARLRAQAVAFHYNTDVLGFERARARISAARTQAQLFAADAFVIAAGSWSSPLLKPLGVSAPVRPAKGYSVSLPRPAQFQLSHPIIDDALHAAMTPLGDTIRLAGTAEFAGFDLGLRQDRIQNLLDLAQRIAPEAAFDMSKARPWCGLRPMSSDGVPIIGPTRINNLWLNTGHGHLGWTMAAGSGRLLAQLMDGAKPELEAEPYALSRFQRGMPR